MHSLDTIPRIYLANLPTPLEEAGRLASHLGLKSLYIKRDDLTGLAGGGNKARKLEYDFAGILQAKQDVVLTAGGVQSNHARMTAAAARKLGIDVKLVLGGADFGGPQGNLLLDVIFDAEIRYLVDEDANDRLTAAMEQWAEQLSVQGRKPCTIPIGGSTGLGALGYTRAMRELAQQIQQDDIQIVIGVGSCGTLAGTILGCCLFLPRARVIGVSVSRSADAIRKRTAEIILEAAALIGTDAGVDPEQIECYDGYFQEYGIMTPAGREAIALCARLEGILLDPIYTGKVMAGLIDLAVIKVIDPKKPVVFVHTGGQPIVFSFASELGGDIRCTRICQK